MNEKRFTYELGNGFSDGFIYLSATEVCELLNELNNENNELEAENEQLKKRLYDFEKRKIIEQSKIDEDVIPRIKLLRTELFGKEYE